MKAAPLALLALACASPERPSLVRLAPCEIERVAPPVECGSVTVPEDRSRPAGRSLALNLVLLRATGPDRAPDPIYVLQGGPGQAATSLAGFYGRVFADLRARHDLLLADVRGTGRSNGLYCSPGDPRRQALFDLDRVRHCRDSLAAQADFRHYTTAANVEDVAAVLDALGVASANVYGTSYGTRLGLELLRRHPERVRTMTLKAVAAPSLILSGDYSRDAFAVVGAVLSPAEQAELDRLLARPPGGMSPGVFSELIRTQLYAPRTARELGARVHRALAGDDSAFAESQDPFESGIAFGMFMSVVCAEDTHPVPDRAGRLPTVRTLGDFREAQQAAACAEWGPVEATTAHREPFSSAVAVLLVSGDLDPVTPPRWGDSALATLSNGVHVVLRENGHAMGDQAACIAAMMQTLIDEGSVSRIAPPCEAVRVVRGR